jgi:hypothetical protein
MILKSIIVFLLMGVVASLMSGLFFLFKDSEDPKSRRLLHALGVRITLATLLLGTIFYGFYTGQLRMGTNAPWHERPAEASTEAQRPLP